MNDKHWMIAAAVAALWLWHKKRGTPDDATTNTANTSQAASTAQDAEGWMGAWGLSK